MVETIGAHISELTRAHVITVMYLGGFGAGHQARLADDGGGTLWVCPSDAWGAKGPWPDGWRAGWRFELGRVEHEQNDMAGVGPEGD